MVFSKYLLQIKNTLLRIEGAHSTIKSINDCALASGIDVNLDPKWWPMTNMHQFKVPANVNLKFTMNI